LKIVCSFGIVLSVLQYPDSHYSSPEKTGRRTMNCKYAKMQIWKSNGEQSPPLCSDRHIPTHGYYNTDDKRLEINSTKSCIRYWSYQKSNESSDIEGQTIQYQKDKQSSKHYRKHYRKLKNIVLSNNS
jgi:hypothetical protein